MSRGGRILRLLLYGTEAEALAIRLDTFATQAVEALDGLVVVVEFASPNEARVRLPLSRGSWKRGQARGCLDRVLEMILPFSEAGIEAGSQIQFRILLEDAGGKRLEALPSEGFVHFSLRAEDLDWVV